MKIIHCTGIPLKYSADVKELLRLSDKEFIPPLSARDDTSQTDFITETKKATEPVSYYMSLCSQLNFLVIDNEQVVGLMSYVCDYMSEATMKDMPNIYISTLIVHPAMRRRGIANKLYSRMLKKYNNRYIFTRTWSTNTGHIRILSNLKFYEHLRLEDNRGEGIDTVYFRREPEKFSISMIIKQYRLQSSIIVFAVLLLLAIGFIYLWRASSNEAMNELYLAFSTSLLASALCLLSDTFIKFREAKNDEYINKLKSFGISNLQFHKDQLLEQIIPHCKEELWISGYRLIMTGKKKFLDAICKSASKNQKLSIRLLVVPPWSDIYGYVYGKDDVSGNYFIVFKTLALLKEKYGTKVEIRFANSPLFNDTYKVDERFITGPYLHCADKNGAKITAKDFFSFDIDDHKKELYEIMEQDYVAIWNKSTEYFDLDSFYTGSKEVNYDTFMQNDSLQNYIIIVKNAEKI